MVNLQGSPEENSQALHDAMVNLGFQRAQALQKRQITHEGADSSTLKILQAALPRLSDEIQVTVSSRTHRGPGSSWLLHLRELDSDNLAELTLKLAARAVLKNTPVGNLVVEIVSMIKSELYYNACLNHDDKAKSKAFKRIKAEIAKKYPDVRKRKLALDKLVEQQYEDIFNEYASVDDARIGVFLVVRLLRALPDIFVLDRRSNGEHITNYLTFTDEAWVVLANLRENLGWMRPHFLPVTYEPHPWENLKSGAYDDPRISTRVAMVKSRNPEHRKLIRKAEKAGKLVDLKKVLSAIQSVPLEVNPWITDMVQEAFDRGLTIGGLPRQTLLEIPAAPGDDAPERDRKRYYRRKKKLDRKNAGVRTGKYQFAVDMGLSRAFTGQPLWLPANCDFRGRVYCVPHWSHHRADYLKAQLRFHEALPVNTQEQADWIAYQVATSGDFNRMSKATIATRVQWTKDNTARIREMLGSPWDHLWWTDADEPFGFLAACQEWVSWLDHGPGFLTRLPVAFDGSNSGLQHFSMAMRSESDAAKVSLLPSSTPADIYQMVGEQLERDLITLTLSDDPDEARLAEVCLRGLRAVGIRKLVKRPTMTFSYSSETYGFREQLITDFMEPLADQVLDGELDEHPFDDGTDDDGYAASGLLAKLIYGIVCRTVSDAARGMEWFKRVAAILAHEGKGLTWETPMGLPVLHAYHQFDAKRVVMTVSDNALLVHDKSGARVDEIVLQLREPIPTKIDKYSAKSAVSPNVIHSLDAAHLQLVVKNCLKIGIEDFLLIHDSFATHATRAAIFSRIIRESMVEMYENYDVFQHIYDAAYKVLSPEGRKKLPTVPEKGTFDIRKVLDSEFAFA